MQVLVNFYRGAIEGMLTGNITNFHGMCKAQDMTHYLFIHLLYCEYNSVLQSVK